MTPVAATLDVSFISNFAGEHRVCWRIVPNLIYNCSTTITCLGGANTCTALIPITVDQETCDPVTYEGYVQAACEAIDSLEGRVPFSITFTPTPTCASYRVTCVDAGVVTTGMFDRGKGYSPATPPAVAVVGGDGIGASATANVGYATFQVAPGDGLYVDGFYPAEPLVNISGIGTGATADVTVLGGFFTVISMVTYGLDYFAGDQFTFAVPGGSGFIIQNDTYYSEVYSLSVVPGSGYTIAPTFVIDPTPSGAGTNAIAKASALQCGAQDLGPTCDGSPMIPIISMPYGQSAIECMASLPVINPSYTFTPEACCYDCKSVAFDLDLLSEATTLFYVDCATQLLTSVYMNPGDSIPATCVVNNSWYWDVNAAIMVVTIGVACP